MESGVQSRQRLLSARVHIGGEVGRCSMAINTRHPDRNGEISRKHGNTLMRTLRRTYGPGFAPGRADGAKLSDCLTKMDEPSLTRLVHDHDGGQLEEIIERGDRASTGRAEVPR